ncbi:MAG: helix-turn-helix domain-containing protein [Natronomonas sp.]
MAHPEHTTGPASGELKTVADHLEAVLSIAPSADHGCAVLDTGKSGAVTSRDTLCHGGDCTDGCTCKSKVTMDETDRSVLIEGSVTDGCVCPVFREYDCVASLESFENRRLVVSLSVPDRDELSAIVAALRGRDAAVQLLRITRPNTEADRRLLRLDPDSITRKQREAVQTAIETGYYASPREASLTDLADELGISPSAASQRLTSVESTLIRELFRAERGVRTSGD